MIRLILAIFLIVLLIVTVYKCEKAGSFSEFVSELIIDGENFLDDTRGKIEEKRKDRDEK